MYRVWENLVCICILLNCQDIPEIGLSPGKGFDLKSQSHLLDVFKSNNICVNWDYSPARELTSVVYPAFEYCLAIYVVLDYAAILLANKRGEISPWFFTFARISFPINVFLVSQFRKSTRTGRFP